MNSLAGIFLRPTQAKIRLEWATRPENNEKKGLLNCTIDTSNKLTISNGLAHLPGVGKYLQEGSWGRAAVDIAGGGNAVTGILDAGRTIFGKSSTGTQLAQTGVGIIADPSMGLNPVLKAVGTEGVPSAVEVLEGGGSFLEAAAEGATGVGLFKIGADALSTLGSFGYCLATQ